MAFVKIDNKYGYIDKTNNLVIPYQFDYASDFKDDYAIVFQLNRDTSKYGFLPFIETLIDKKGNYVSNQWFTSIYNRNDTSFNVSVKDKNYLLFKDGKLKESFQSSGSITYSKVDYFPSFPGGDEGLRNYINKNIIYPQSALNNGIRGKVFIRFVVLSDGKVDNVNIMKGVHPLLDKAAMYSLKNMPRWIPGKMKGQPVNVWYTVPIGFNSN